MPHLDPPGERVEILYEGKHLAGVLRLFFCPRARQAPLIVLITMGLDSTKEELRTTSSSTLRCMAAILAFDGPGQGQAEHDFPIRYDYENVVGVGDRNRRKPTTMSTPT